MKMKMKMRRDKRYWLRSFACKGAGGPAWGRQFQDDSGGALADSNGESRRRKKDPSLRSG